MTAEDAMSPMLTPEHLAELERAVQRLENPGFIARVTDVVGQPLEKVIRFLPAGASDQFQDVVRGVLERLLDVAVRSLEREPPVRSSTLFHRVASGASGAVGGFFGAPALAVELPISTTIILRSIADIARREGEDLAVLDARLACLEVFALGGRSRGDDGAETGYYAVRAGLAKAVSDAARHLSERGLSSQGAPAIARLIAQISSRFGVAVSEKVAAQAVPVLGAIGGAGINLLFVDHFQDMARGHFVVRRLERIYGVLAVQEQYTLIRDRLTGGRPDAGAGRGPAGGPI